MRLLRRLAPGLLVAATGVGAGDLITASLAGAEVGVVVLWAVLVGSAFKLVLNEGLARWQIATGETLLEGWVRHLGTWIQWVFVAYLLVWTWTVGGALMKACGLAGDALFRLGPDPATSQIVWGVLHSLAGMALALHGGFALFETVMGVSVALMVVTVLATTLWIGFDPAPVLHGALVPSIPPGGLSWVLGLLGGVGGTLTLLSYGYWIREEGRQGEDGLRACRLDLAVAYSLTAVFSICMVILGSRLPGLAGPKAQLAVRLADALTPTLGAPGRLLFLLGFWAAVSSSLLGVWQGVPYLFADFVRLRRRGVGPPDGAHADAPPEDLKQTRAYRGYLLALGTLPALNLLRPLASVQLAYAVLGAFFMPLLALTLLLMNTRPDWVGPAHRSGRATNAALVVVLLFFAWAGWMSWTGG